MWAGLLRRVIHGTAAFRGVTVAPMSAGRGLAPLADVADVADGQRRDGFPEPVVRREHSVIAVPVFPRRRHEVREPVEERNRLQFDDASGPRPRGPSAAAAASSRRRMRNHRIVRRRTHSVRAARSAGVIGRAGRCLGSA